MTEGPGEETREEVAPAAAPAGEESPPEPTPPTPEVALGWKGWKLDDLGGSTVGKVEGVLVDADGGEAVWLMVRLGRFGHYTALPFAHAVEGAGRVWAPYARAVLRGAPRLQAGQALTRERELELCAHFGLDGSGGRAAAIEARPAESVTAQLATAPGS